MNILRIQEPNASRVTRTSECEMRLTLSSSSGAGQGQLCSQTATASMHAPRRTANIAASRQEFSRL
jgi:hypothetical protein